MHAGVHHLFPTTTVGWLVGCPLSVLVQVRGVEVQEVSHLPRLPPEVLDGQSGGVLPASEKVRDIVGRLMAARALVLNLRVDPVPVRVGDDAVAGSELGEACTGLSGEFLLSWVDFGRRCLEERVWGVGAEVAIYEVSVDGFQALFRCGWGLEFYGGR